MEFQNWMTFSHDFEDCTDEIHKISLKYVFFYTFEDDYYDIKD